jgi:hypothetical protein
MEGRKRVLFRGIIYYQSVRATKYTINLSTENLLCSCAVVLATHCLRVYLESTLK